MVCSKASPHTSAVVAYRYLSPAKQCDQHFQFPLGCSQSYTHSYIYIAAILVLEVLIVHSFTSAPTISRGTATPPQAGPSRDGTLKDGLLGWLGVRVARQLVLW